MASLKKRGKQYYAQYYAGGRQRRVNLKTASRQVAKEKIRQIESSQARGRSDFLPEPSVFSDDPSCGVVPPRFPHNGYGTTKNPLEQRDVPLGPSGASRSHQVEWHQVK